MRRDRNWPLSIYSWLVYVVLFAPIVVLILFSFNDSKRNFVWRGFTLDWYPTLFADRRAAGRPVGDAPGGRDLRGRHHVPGHAPWPRAGAHAAWPRKRPCPTR